MNPLPEPQSLPHHQKPISKEALVALGMALVAVSLGILGIYSPWGALRVPLEARLTGTNAILVYGGTFIFPIVLGLGAALLGGHAYATIDRAAGTIRGDGQAFFSLMIGLFAVVIGFCTTFAGLIWPML